MGSLTLGPTKAARLETISEALAPLDNAACNTHLVLFLLDALVLALFPDFAAGPEPGSIVEGSLVGGLGLVLGAGVSAETGDEEASERLTLETDEERSKRSSQIAVSR